MIECRSLTVRRGERTIFQQVSFTAAPGEITVLLGRNGSGKTTLLRAISGSVRCGGEILLDGSALSDLSRRELSRRLALLPQILPGPEVTVRELVSFGRQPYTGFSGRLSSADAEKVAAVLEEMELAPLAAVPVHRLSGGERQRAFWALLLAQDTPNLLLDEPGAHLDAVYSRQTAEFLRAEKRKGKTVLAVLHDVNRAVEIADHLLVLDGGRLVFNGGRQTFLDSRTAEEVFGLTRYEGTAGEKRRTLFQ